MKVRIVGGKYKNHPIFTPSTFSTRPTTAKLRETLFNIIGPQIENSVFLDLFAGSGAIGLEALSRGASFCVFVEQSKQPYQCIEKNLEKLHLEDHAITILADVKKAVKKIHKKFDFIYLDPPYALDKNTVTSILEFIVEYGLLDTQGQIFLEQSSSVKLEISFLETISIRKSGSSCLYQFSLKKSL